MSTKEEKTRAAQRDQVEAAARAVVFTAKSDAARFTISDLEFRAAQLVACGMATTLTEARSVVAMEACLWAATHGVRLGEDALATDKTP